jgi:hypothetical protein
MEIWKSMDFGNWNEIELERILVGIMEFIGYWTDVITIFYDRVFLDLLSLSMELGSGKA